MGRMSTMEDSVLPVPNAYPVFCASTHRMQSSEIAGERFAKENPGLGLSSLYLIPPIGCLGRMTTWIGGLWEDLAPF